MKAFLWDWMTPEQRAEASRSVSRHKLASVRMRAQDSLNGGPEAIWVDHGNGDWYCAGALYAEDLAKGVTIEGAPKEPQ